MALRSLALCAGIGGLDLGVKLARPDHLLVGAVERQAYCAAVLVERMGAAQLDPAPIWDDLVTFDGRRWCGAVDLVTAGYPCQPESLAGSRRGELDERWLWGEVWRVVREVGPSLVFLENVAGHLSGTFGRVVGDMAASGWRVEWDCIPAASVGAPHLRDRLFVLAAHPDGDGLHRIGERGLRQERDASGRSDPNGLLRPWPAHANDDESEAARCSGVAADAARAGREGERARGHAAGEPWDARRGSPEPVFRRVVDGVRHRLDVDWADRIHALGNSVVPQAAVQAWRVLEQRLIGKP